jgi:Flp pilus assembly pilin Flp
MLKLYTSLQARAAAREEEGQTMAEYAVVLGVITLAAVGAFQALGGGVTTTLNEVIGRM